MNVESFFAALTGGEELEIDFPSDRLFRKLGVYLRLLFAAILIGASFTTPNVCYKPGPDGYGAAAEKTEELTANYVNSYCYCKSKYASLDEMAAGGGGGGGGGEGASTPSQEELDAFVAENSRVFLFSFLPYALIVEALLSFLPYLTYATKTKHIVQPILNEAQDMAILTSGMFEECKSKENQDDDTDPDDDSEDEEHYAKSIQISLKKRLYAKMSLFIGQRLKCLEGYELVDHYNFCHVIVKSLVILLQCIIIGVFIRFSFPFPLRLFCPLPTDLQTSLNTTFVSCIFPNNGMSAIFVVVDAILTLAIPIVSWSRYRRYWKRGFYRDLKRARRLVPATGLDQFNDFIKHMCTAKAVVNGGGKYAAAASSDAQNGENGESIDLHKEEKLVPRTVDDIRLTLALLHANVDKFIANKIMTVYAGRVDFDASDEMDVHKEKTRGGCCKGALRWLRPRLVHSKWMFERDTEVET